MLANPGTQTRVAPDSLGASWTGPLPPGSEGLELGESDVSPDAVTRRGDSAIVSAPIAPGEKQLAFQYHVPAGRQEIEIPVGAEPVALNCVARGAGRDGYGARARARGQPVDSRADRSGAGAATSRRTRRCASRCQVPRPMPRRSSPRMVAVLALALLVAAWRLLPRAPAVSTDRLVGRDRGARHPVSGQGSGDRSGGVGTISRAAGKAQGGARGRPCPGVGRPVNLRAVRDPRTGRSEAGVRRRGPATVTGAHSAHDATGQPGRRAEARSQETSPFAPPSMPSGGRDGWLHVRLASLRRARRAGLPPARPSRTRGGGRRGRLGRRAGSRHPRGLADPGQHRASLRDRRRTGGRGAHRVVRLPSRNGRRSPTSAPASTPTSKPFSRRGPISSSSTTRPSMPTSRRGCGSSASRPSGSTPMRWPTCRASARCSAGSPDMRAEADSMSAVFDTALAAATTDPGSARRPKVLLLVWEQPPMTIGRGSFLSELVERAGGRESLRRRLHLVGAGEHRGGERARSGPHPHDRRRAGELRRASRMAGGARRPGAAVPQRLGLGVRSAGPALPRRDSGAVPARTSGGRPVRRGTVRDRPRRRRRLAGARAVGRGGAALPGGGVGRPLEAKTPRPR